MLILVVVCLFQVLRILFCEHCISFCIVDATSGIYIDHDGGSMEKVRNAKRRLVSFHDSWLVPLLSANPTKTQCHD